MNITADDYLAKYMSVIPENNTDTYSTRVVRDSRQSSAPNTMNLEQYYDSKPTRPIEASPPRSDHTRPPGTYDDLDNFRLDDFESLQPSGKTRWAVTTYGRDEIKHTPFKTGYTGNGEYRQLNSGYDSPPEYHQSQYTSDYMDVSEPDAPAETTCDLSTVCDMIPDAYKSINVIYLCRLYFLPDDMYRYKLGFSDDIEATITVLNSDNESEGKIEIIALLRNVTEDNLIVGQYALNMLGLQISDGLYSINFIIRDMFNEKKNFYTRQTSAIVPTDVHFNPFYTIDQDDVEKYWGGLLTEFKHTQSLDS
jgi:hypothetical protein